MSEPSPLGAWVRRNAGTLTAAGPWMITALVALGLAAAVGGWNGFNVGLAVGGTALGLWGAFLSAQATRDGREVREVVRRIHAADAGGRLIAVLEALAAVKARLDATPSDASFDDPAPLKDALPLIRSYSISLHEADFGGTCRPVGTCISSCRGRSGTPWIRSTQTACSRSSSPRRRN